ncbi:MAG: hypothetical protein M3Z20_02880 [Chloroflexota bacterium]|nr:hypothetical protein [Chloroflexota bacterium]
MADSAHTASDWVDDEYFFDEDLGVIVLTEEQSADLFDREARKALGISGEEFLRRWDAGEFRPIPDTPEGWPIARLVMSIPFVRRVKA